MGTGKEYFGLDSSLNANAPPVWMPYTLLDQLLVELKDTAGGRRGHGDGREEQVYQKLHAQLSDTLEHYLETVARTSKDKADLMRQKS